MGVEDRGELALVSGLVGIFSQIGLLGLPAAVLYFVAARHVPALRLLRLVGGGLVARALACAVLAAGTLVLLGVVSDPLRHPVGEALLTAAGVTVIVLGFSFLAGVQGEQRYTAYTVLNALPFLIYAATVVVLVAARGASMVAFLGANVAGWVAVPLLAVPLLRRRRPPEPTGGYAVPTRREVRRFGIRSWIASAAPTDMLGIDQVIIGALLGHAPLGLYVIGWAFETGTVLPGTALAGFVGPRVASAEPRHQIALARTWALRSLGFAVLVCIAVEALLEPVIRIAYGDAARGALAPARVLVLAGVFLGLRRVLAYTLQALGRPQWSTLAEMLSFATMLAGVLGLGPVFGVQGCAWGMVAAGVVGSTTQLAMLARARSEGV